jgi:hypothetical protein
MRGRQIERVREDRESERIERFDGRERGKEMREIEIEREKKEKDMNVREERGDILERLE